MIYMAYKQFYIEEFCVCLCHKLFIENELNVSRFCENPFLPLVGSPAVTPPCLKEHFLGKISS